MVPVEARSKELLPNIREEQKPVNKTYVVESFENDSTFAKKKRFCFKKI